MLEVVISKIWDFEVGLLTVIVRNLFDYVIFTLCSVSGKCLCSGCMHALHTANINSFTWHINSIKPHIKFTSEQEEDGKLPFVDTCLHMNEDGSTNTTVYRKPTHTYQYLSFTSNHHLHHERSVVMTLLHRAEHLVSEEEDRKKEVRDIQNALSTRKWSQMLDVQNPFLTQQHPHPKPQEQHLGEHKINLRRPALCVRTLITS